MMIIMIMMLVMMMVVMMVMMMVVMMVMMVMIFTLIDGLPGLFRDDEDGDDDDFHLHWVSGVLENPLLLLDLLPGKQLLEVGGR